MTSPERGSGTLLWFAAGVVGSLVVAALVGVHLFQIQVHRVQGAADLVALTAANVRNLGSDDPCEAAGRAAYAATVDLEHCDWAGRDIDFVVTVRVKADAPGLVGRALAVRAEAHAGVRTEG